MRTMSFQSKNTPALHKFIVYAPDMSDEDAFQRRLCVRRSHLDGAKSQARKGVISKHLDIAQEHLLTYLAELAGAMLTPESISPNTEKKMVGTVLLCESDSLDTVRSLVESDIYYTSGVVSILLGSRYDCGADVCGFTVGQEQAGYFTDCACRPPFI